MELSKEDAERIFEEYSNSIYRFALFLTKSRMMADDITQETFIQVFRKYYTFDATKPFKPWIYKIALNTTRNMQRKQKWLQFFQEIPERDCSDLVENTVMKSEEEKELWKWINRLGPKSREIIVLHFYTGMKLAEVADFLDIPLGTCKSRLNTALNNLRRQFPESEFTYLIGGDAYETT